MKAINILAAIAVAATSLTASAKQLSGTLALGDFDSPSDYYAGTAWEAAPANYFFTYSSSQIIYTAEELAEIADVNGKITKVTFKYVEAAPGYGNHELSMDICLDDATEDAFVKDAAGKYKWMPFSDTCKGSWTYELENYNEGEATEVEITLDTPYEVKPGTSLVITTTASNSEATAYIDCFTAYCYAAAGRPKRAASKCSDVAEVLPVPGAYIEHQSGQWSSGEFAEVPVVKFDYVYDDATDGIASVAADADAAVYYNLQGMRVDAPTSGIYVKVQGGRATKVAL